MQVRKVESALEDLIDRFQSIFGYIDSYLVNRKEELEAIKLALLCREHVLLEGPPGVAKSMLARFVFSCVDPADAIVFRKQLMANTTTDEVFGPMNIKKLREDAVWEFNTAGMFPEAHFAFLDEIYRASDALMSSMLGVLNERTFHNGLKEIECPLLSAIGTTNFIADRPELEAFHDRWLIRCVSRPADSSEARRRILSLFMSHDPDQFTIVEPLALRELQRLQTAVRNVQLPEEFQDLYEELSSKYKANAGSSCYVSDRRYCQAYRLVQAQFLLQCSALRVEKAPPSCISAARYGLIQEGTKEHVAAMDDAIASVIGAIERMEKEEPEISQFEEEGLRICSRYDPSMPTDRKRKMFERVAMILDKMKLMSPEEQFTLPRNIERLAKVVRRLEEVHETLKQAIN